MLRRRGSGVVEYRNKGPWDKLSGDVESGNKGSIGTRYTGSTNSGTRDPMMDPRTGDGTIQRIEETRHQRAVGI